MTFNLFALTSDPARRIVRFSLSGEIQEELTTHLKTQETQFLEHVEETIKFDGKYKPEQGEVLEIDNYDDIDGLANAIENPLDLPEITPSIESYRGIKAIFSGYMDTDGSAVILLQNFDKRMILSNEGISIFHSENTYKKVCGVGLTIDTKLSAILKGSSLKFFSFHMVRQIFDLSEYYREATDTDIRDFVGLPTIKSVDLTNLIAISDTWVRRKFSLIQQSRILETVSINQIRTVAQEFNIPLIVVVQDELELIELPQTKSELKTLLRFLDEDYYKSPLSQTQWITNSKRLAQIHLN
ncbi:hypothetical protein D3C86_1226640 [compost metagenome]